MKLHAKFYCLMILSCMILAASSSYAQFETSKITDLFSTGTLDSHWLGVGGGGKDLVSETATIPSSDSTVLQITGGSQALLAQSSETWQNVTVSCWILPVGGGDTRAQGLILGPQSDFSFADTDDYFCALYLRNGGASTIRLMLNGGDVNNGFPGATGAEVTVPGDPLDGNYHKLSLVVDRDGTNPLIKALWDDSPVATFGPDADWGSRVPAGMAGLVTCYGSGTDTYRFDKFEATWDNAPAVPVELSSFDMQ